MREVYRSSLIRGYHVGVSRPCRLSEFTPNRASLKSTSKVGFCEHCAATIAAEFDDGRAEKLKKIKLPQHRFSFNYFFTKRR